MQEYTAAMPPREGTAEGCILTQTRTRQNTRSWRRWHKETGVMFTIFFFIYTQQKIYYTFLFLPFSCLVFQGFLQSNFLGCLVFINLLHFLHSDWYIFFSLLLYSPFKWLYLFFFYTRRFFITGCPRRRSGCVTRIGISYTTSAFSRKTSGFLYYFLLSRRPSRSNKSFMVPSI